MTKANTTTKKYIVKDKNSNFEEVRLNRDTAEKRMNELNEFEYGIDLAAYSYYVEKQI